MTEHWCVSKDGCSCNSTFCRPLHYSDTSLRVRSLAQCCNSYSDQCALHSVRQSRNDGLAECYATPRSIQRPGCMRWFDRDSAMVLHLEAGSCSSGIDADAVDNIAFACYQSRHYTFDDRNFDFKCPGYELSFSFKWRLAAC
ncbi:hypothetical protein F5Y12DRAFT_283356 [Xylaria sp. FL1777]|nr:hypothetical protein F5Y12DRAFT_283356 [Xylaria sp. FL1777]